MRIVETRLVNIDERGRDAEAGAASARSQADVGTSRFVAAVRIADLGRLRSLRDAAALEGAEILAGLHDLPARKRHELRQRAFRDLLGRRRRDRLQALRFPVAAVALAKDGSLAADDSV